MTALRPLTDAEYATWRERAIAAYAQEKVASGAWAEDEAIEKSRGEHGQLLPQGRDTPDHHLFAIVSASDEAVGVLWFANILRAKARVAYVYDLVIWPEHRRRGHAARAFMALELQARGLGLHGIALHVFGHNRAARALYDGLGYEPTNISLYKPLGDDAPGGDRPG